MVCRLNAETTRGLGNQVKANGIFVERVLPEERYCSNRLGRATRKENELGTEASSNEPCPTRRAEIG